MPSLHLSYSAVVINLIVGMTVIWLKYDNGELTKVDIEIRTDTDFYDVKKALKLEAPNRFGGLDAAAITVKNPRTQLPINSDELLEPFLRADGENVLRFLVNAPLAGNLNSI